MQTSLRDKLTKNSFGYILCRIFWTTPNHTRYYRNINILGRENIPAKGPVIYAINHQNALMDAMAIVSTQKYQTVFVARADIFNKPLFIKLFHFMRILPISRRRDGGNLIDNNQETLEIVDQVLRNRLAHGIMPEGSFNPRRRLAPLQKGICRTALKAQEAFGITGGVQIVPVGLNWQDPTAHFKDVTIVYGKAIPVADFYPLYVENPNVCYVKLLAKIREGMKALMVDIQSETFYDTINQARVYFAPEKALAQGLNPEAPGELLLAQQSLVAELENTEQTKPETLQELQEELKEYTDKLKSFGLRNALLRKEQYSRLELWEDAGVLLLGFPFALIGACIGFLPLYFAEKYKRAIKDPQFLSSVRYVVAMTIRGVLNFCLIVFALLTYNNLLHLLLMLLLIIFGERLMLFYLQCFKKLRGKIRYNRLLKSFPGKMQDLHRLRLSMLKKTV